MAGLNQSVPQPTEIRLHQKSRILEIAFADGASFRLPCEFLRVYSPSAEVRGHGPGQEVLQAGKKDVEITRIDPVGSYAVQLAFSDVVLSPVLFAAVVPEPRTWVLMIAGLAFVGYRASRQARARD